MKRIFALILALSLLLCGCGKEEPTETTQASQETTAATQATENSGEGEGVLDPTTEIRYLIVKKIVTNDQGQELWGTEYTYDDTGFCTNEREYSNIGSASYSRTNSPDARNRIASSLYTQLDGSQYTVTYTYDDFDRCVREDVRYEDGTEEYTEYTYNDKGQYLTLKQYIAGELIMDYAFSYTYDGLGNQVSMDEYLSGDLLYHVAFTYDEEGRKSAPSPLWSTEKSSPGRKASGMA